MPMLTSKHTQYSHLNMRDQLFCTAEQVVLLHGMYWFTQVD